MTTNSSHKSVKRVTYFPIFYLKIKLLKKFYNIHFLHNDNLKNFLIYRSKITISTYKSEFLSENESKELPLLFLSNNIFNL